MDYDENDEGLIFAGDYEAMEEEDFASSDCGLPDFKFHTYVSAKEFRRGVLRLQAPLLAAIAAFALAGFTIAAFAAANKTRFLENDVIFIFMSASVPWGIAAALAIKYRLTDPASGLRARKRLYGDDGFSIDYAFYYDLFTYRDKAEDGAYFKKPLLKEEYSSIKDLLITDGLVFMRDGSNAVFAMKRSDAPEDLPERLEKLCANAGRIIKG